ncbi:dolichol kinase [Hydra vulgaris]|uniref:dolichol kinase n=1 Tax=Hydra vulgaris TaxID=6087 RepID=UPI001F5F74D8|nr:dolichol kinase [Hydra vulgaris]
MCEKLKNVKFLTENIIGIFVAIFVILRTSGITCCTLWSAVIILNTSLVIILEQFNCNRLKNFFKLSNSQNSGFVYANLTLLSVAAIQTSNCSFYLENVEEARLFQFALHFITTIILIVSNFMVSTALVTSGLNGVLVILTYINFPKTEYSIFIVFVFILVIVISFGIFVFISDKSFTFTEVAFLFQCFWIVFFDLHLRFLNVNMFCLENIKLSIVLELALLLIAPVIFLIMSDCFLIILCLPFLLLMMIFILTLYYAISLQKINLVLIKTVLLLESKWILLLYWCFLVFFSLVVVYWYALTAQTNKIPKTVIRKIFHFIALFIYLFGWSESELLALISSLVFYAFIVTEIMRVKKNTVGLFLNNFLEPFRDENDSGKFILSHVYLILGLSLPFWLTPYSILQSNSLKSLSIFSGVISLGIGDSFASIFGSLYGKSKWSGSNKSHIGTFCCFLSQFLFSIILLKGLSINISFISICMLSFVCFVVSMLETFSSQNDNLILPVYMYILFMLL